MAIWPGNAFRRFATAADLMDAQCTVEEREEYEPHLAAGSVVFVGVDYAEILQRAEAEADIVVWEGGNNDFPFVRPDLNTTVADALRPRQVATHHPGETVARMADVFVINKVDSASRSPWTLPLGAGLHTMQQIAFADDTDELSLLVNRRDGTDMPVQENLRSLQPKHLTIR
jgi:hypothetical protein